MVYKRLIVSIFFLSLLLSGCAGRAPDTEDILSPEETVEEYFKYWIAKDNEKMNSLVTDGNKAVVYELERMTFLELGSIEPGDVSYGWNDAWYEDPYDHICFNVTFTIEFMDGHGAGFDNGTYSWQYYLVRDSDDSNWLIVMWGVA